MHIACPSCSASYEVPDSLVTPGRIVRCARCNEEWVALRIEAPATPEPEETEPAEPAVEFGVETPRLSAMERLAQPPPRRSGGPALRAAWVASIALLLGLLWAGYAWRVEVMAGWPASMRVYSALGLVAQPH